MTMNGFKGFMKSRTLWALLLGQLGALASGLLGVNIDLTDQIFLFDDGLQLSDAIELASLVLAAYFRVDAKEQITVKRLL